MANPFEFEDSPNRRQMIVTLAIALKELPRSEADVLWLYHARCFSFDEIGERIGMPRKDVRGLWARGLKSLKRYLTEHTER